MKRSDNYQLQIPAFLVEWAAERAKEVLHDNMLTFQPGSLEEGVAIIYLKGIIDGARWMHDGTLSLRLPAVLEAPVDWPQLPDEEPR